MNKYKQEMIDTINKMNSKLNEFNLNLDLVIVGGAAFILSDLVDRTTTDIDFINKADRNAIGLLVNNGIDINDNAKIFDYQFGENWDKDVIVLFEMSNLTLRTISVERLMVGRLFTRRRSDDFISSIKNSKINQAKFEKILNEVYVPSIDMEQKSFRENKYMIKELYQKKGWDYETSNIKDLC